MRYLTAEDIIKINVMVIGKYSPNEPVGIADPNSLRMIVEQPKQEIFGKVLYPDIYSKPAIIWINLIKKHPFYIFKYIFINKKREFNLSYKSIYH